MYEDILGKGHTTRVLLNEEAANNTSLERIERG